ncbi:MAG: glycosyltransferase family 39 protein [Candidatus Nealsonbacteria bacterium]|nr:glycosyltransferase family 39 protein [Candidatus Nealsonbacteria bacterium]
MPYYLFQKKWFIAFSLVFLIFLQLIYGFIFPTSGRADTWQPISAYLPKFHGDTSDGFILGKVYPLVSKDYRLNSDSGDYLELAKNFNSEMFRGHIYINRPLYPFLISLASLPLRPFINISYGIIFALAILINFIAISLAVFLFFKLIREIFSLKVAWLSSVLLIFSPFTHSLLNQPIVEMLTALMVAVSCYCLYDYVKKPTPFKLAAYSLIIGVFLLGKMFYAVTFFFLLLAVYSRRFKEGAVFFALHLVPFILWYLWVTQVWHISYYVNEVQNWQMGVWLFDFFRGSWPSTAKILLSLIPNFMEALIYGFMLVPVILSLIGFRYMPMKSKNMLYFGSLFSVFSLGFIMNLYLYRHAFLLFPIIYPTAVLGVEKIAGSLKKYHRWLSPVFYAAMIGLMIFVSQIDIQRIFNYLKS